MCSSFRVNTSLQASASLFIPPTPSKICENCLDKLEGMMKKVLTRLDDKEREPYHRRNKSVCQFCKKPGHTEERCFKKKTCRKSNQVGHIAKFCKDAKTDSLVVDSSLTHDEKVEPAQ